MPQVLNARGTGWTDDTLPPGSVYVGRAVVGGWQGGVRFRMSKWRNPFTIGRRDGTRDEVIGKYRSWLLQQPELMAAVHEFRGRDLVCWCTPDPCHADVLIELANDGLGALC
jgi:Domain of unknown function (DUF4326)